MRGMLMVRKDPVEAWSLQDAFPCPIIGWGVCEWLVGWLVSDKCLEYLICAPKASIQFREPSK